MTHDSEKFVHAKSHPTVKINSKRFEQSPYAPRYITDETLFGCYCDRFYPIAFGDDVIDQYWKLRKGGLLFDVPEKPLDIRGPDTVTLLNRVFSRRVETLKSGRAHYAIACTPRGGVQMDGVLIRLADDHFWYVHANGDFQCWLTAFSEGLDVEITDPKSRVLQVQGPRSLEILKALDGKKDISGFGYFHAGHFDFGGQTVLVTRTGWTGELGFEVYSNCGNQTDHLALWDYIVDIGALYGLENAALEVMGIRRIEAGILDYGTDINQNMTPFDIGLGQFVDFSKDDFVGKQALQDADREVRLFGVVSETGIPKVGDHVFEQQQKVAEIRVGDWSPTLGKGIGYVYFDQPAKIESGWVGRQLTLRDNRGIDHPCDIVDLPFYDRKKHIPRGKTE